MKNIKSYLIGLKSSITYTFPQIYAKIKIDSDDDLPLNETMTFHNVIILLKSAFNKNQNYHYYNTFLEQFPYQLAKKLLQENFSDSY